MLYNGVNHFNWKADNYTNAAGGTVLPGHANAHEKGADTALLAGLAYDCWGLYINFGTGSTVATARRQLTDILIDPAAGTGNAGSSWSVLINNLFTQGPSLGTANTGHHFYFPIFIPAGTAIGGRHQDGTAGTLGLTCRIRAYGHPTRPDLVKVGHKVETLGAITATTLGTGLTPAGSAAWGTYVSVGTLTNDAWWWQLGVGANDTIMTDTTYSWDIAVNATNKLTCLYDLITANNTDEISSKQAYGATPPIQHVPAGETVYVRGSCINTTADAGFTAVVYAVT